jgi:hypothetical protein
MRHTRTRAASLALTALTGAVAFGAAGPASADSAVSPTVTVAANQVAQSVEPGAAVVITLDVSSVEALAAPGGGGSTEAVKVCAIGPSLRLDDATAADSDSQCAGWIEAGDRNNARVRILVNPDATATVGPLTYSVIAFDSDSSTTISTDLPAVTVEASVTPSAVSVARVFQQQTGLQYWVASPDNNATWERSTDDGQTYAAAGAPVSRFGGGFVFNNFGSPGDLVRLRTVGGDGSIVRYRNILGVVPAAPTLTGVPTGTRFTSGAMVSWGAAPALGTRYRRIGANGTWVGIPLESLVFAPDPSTFISIPQGLPDGTYNVSAQYVDGAGRPGAIATSTSWTVSNAAPTVTGAPTADVAVGTNVELTATKAGAVSFAISTNGGTTFGTPQASGAFTVTNAAAGARQIRIRAIDSVGGSTALASVTYNVVTAPPTTVPPASGLPSYLIVNAAGGVTAFPSGSTAPARTTAAHAADASVFEIAMTADGLGAYTMDDSGFVVAYGTATLKTGLASNVGVSQWFDDEFAVGFSLTASGNGYWVFTNAGRALAYGDATDFQDLVERNTPLNEQIIDAAAAVGTNGVYLVAEDGGVFAFGDAPFRGSIPGITPRVTLNQPMIGILPTSAGYYLVAQDGGVFAFPDSLPFRGSIPGLRLPVPLNAPISAMVNQGSGYLLVGEDGGVFAFGTPFSGSLGATGSNIPVTGIAARQPA